MNRLVIIGNGFDLAHGLPTSYKDFIDDYWKNILEELNNNHSYKDSLFTSNVSRVDNDYHAKVDWQNNVKSLETLKSFISKYDKYCTLEFTNKFFLNINNQMNIEKWVDIENIYYDLLKSISSGNYNKHNYPWGISRLNEEFEQVKLLLEEYLNKKVLDKYNLDFIKNQNIDWKEIYNVLKPISLFSNEDNILKEFVKVEDVKEIKEHFDNERKEDLVNNLYFLNFNYTPIASIYSDLLDKDDRIESKMNFIHGSLENILENKINFGFGDEMDDDYKAIENLNDNEYLRNFKSFQYLQNSNYNDLLRFIDSEKFQVLIMGHSCGLSDRTLLNTIFEHEKCRSIKVYYHETKDEDDTVVKDNYTEIIQNISRHFNKKKLMREKIVNKTLCRSLPQIQLPKYKNE